jgi:hypothetical protein
VINDARIPHDPEQGERDSDEQDPGHSEKQTQNADLDDGLQLELVPNPEEVVPPVLSRSPIPITITAINAYPMANATGSSSAKRTIRISGRVKTYERSTP